MRLVDSACPLPVISRSAAVPSAPSAQRRTPLDPSRSSYATGCQAPALLSRMNFCCAVLVGEGCLAWKCVLPWKRAASPVLCSLDIVPGALSALIFIHSSEKKHRDTQYLAEVAQPAAGRPGIAVHPCPAQSLCLSLLLVFSGVGGPRLVFQNP